MSTVPPEDRYLSREDSLEYFIKFPTPSFEQIEYTTNDCNLVHNESNVPIVLLLGWAGCQDRYLMKYSKIYEDRGLITVRYTAPVENIFWQRNAMRPISQKIVKLLYDMNFNSHPLIVHVFSNGGAYLYHHIECAMKEAQTPLDICGIIFDSAPGDRRLMGLYRAISMIYGKEKRFNCIVSWFVTIGLALRCVTEDAFNRFMCLFGLERGIDPNPYNSLKTSQSNAPQLFLYSNQDKLIPSRDVETFAKIRHDMGIHVETICFTDAEHVKLYAKYPQKYIQCICKFINECLANLQSGMN